MMLAGNACSRPGLLRAVLRPGRRLRPPLNEGACMLYLTGVLTVAALFYLAYVMIRPEKF